MSGFTDFTTATLTEFYNQQAEKQGKKTVKRFSSRTNLIQRLEKDLGITEDQYRKTMESSEKPAKSRKKRGRTFMFPFNGGQVKSVREGTNRHKLIQMLSKGATFQECIDATWGNKFDAAKAEKTCYEAIRLLHSQVGYGMNHDLETGVITLTTEG